MLIKYEEFDWETYIKVNPDLNFLNKKITWEHWLNHGIFEERPIDLINNTNIHNGRFGNLFFVNMVLHFIALKMNLKCRYKYFNKFKELGINLFVGEKTYEKEFTPNDNNFLDFIQNNDNEKYNIIINNNSWFQNSYFCDTLKLYFNMNHNKLRIINNNIYKNRYNNNNDVFFHIRLGDIGTNILNIQKYYETALSQIKYDTGYISSDTIDHELCRYLINKYNLIKIETCEVKTIMFATTCNNIILSGGTFSWLIGFFSFFSENIYYPNIEIPWYGDIFNFSDWKCIYF
jgi:hypothetical protein